MKVVAVVLALSLGGLACGSKKPTAQEPSNAMMQSGGSTYGGAKYGGNAYGGNKYGGRR